MRSMRRRLITISAVLIGTVIAIAFVTIGQPFGGRVVDADSGTPLVDVQIVAAWNQVAGTLGGTVHEGTLHVLATRTDAQGAYRFPGWVRMHGPYFPLSLVGIDPASAPRLYVFKPGFVPREENSGDVARAPGFFILRKPFQRGRELRLQRSRAPGSVEDIRDLQSFETTIVGVLARPGGGWICEWDRLAPMLSAIRATLGSNPALSDQPSAIAQCER
jgi:hypothetical protein